MAERSEKRLATNIRRPWWRCLGSRIYHHLRRQADWRLSGKKFAGRREPGNLLPVTVIRHESPLLRELARAEMWMQRNKVINLKLAVAALDGLVLRPGEVFSYWRLIGPPTRTRGFVQGMTLQRGRIKPGIGGGLCQLSNLVYWMTLHTPLSIIERWRHSYDVFPDTNRTLPFGSGATCSYPSLDLQVLNATDAVFQLNLWLTESHLVGEWRCNETVDRRYEVYQDYHEISHMPHGGYVRHNTIRRRVYNLDGALIGDELVTENHALMMYQPFLAGRNDSGSR